MMLMNQITGGGRIGPAVLLVLSVALGPWAPAALGADNNSAAKAHLQIRRQCEKRMKAVGALEAKLKTLPGDRREKLSDPRFAQRLAAWKKASTLFAAKSSSGAAKKEDLQEYLKAFDRAYSTARWIRLRMLGIDRILAVKRSPIRSGHVYEYHNPGFEKGGSAGGGVYECIPGPDGYKTRRIVDAGDGLIARCDLSFDAREILLNWRKPGKHFQVYRTGVDGTGLKQLTSGNYDNYDSCWLPVGDIVFISNRDMQWALCLWTPMGVMYRMDRNGEAQKRISANYLQDFTPTVTSDGRIMFSRWEYVDRPVQPTKGIWTMEPDGSMMRGYYGNRVLSPKAFVDARTIPGTQRVICTLAGHLGWLYGALGAIDPSLGDNTQAAITSLTPECNTGKVDKYRANSDFLGRYETPYPIDKNHYLFSLNGVVMLRDFAGTEEWLILDRKDGKGFYSARPLRARATPPVRRSALDPRAGKWAEIIVQDVYQGLLPHVKRGQVKQICVVQELPKAGPRNQLRQTALDGHQFSVVSGHGTFAAKKVCGYANVAPDGSAYFKAPADVPIYFMAIDAEGKAVQRMRTWTQFRPGEKHSCIGCHESRLAAPRPGRRPAAIAGGVRSLIPPEWGGDGFSYPAVVQPIWDRYCLRCHDGVKEPKSIDMRSVQTRFFCRSYDLLVPWRWARNADKYEKQYGRKPYVNWIPTTSWSGSEGFVRDITPNKWGSPASSLTKLIVSGHPDKNGKKRLAMDDKSRRRIFAWIDLNVPFYGSYRGPVYQDPETLRRRKVMLSKINGWSETLRFGGRAQYGSFVGRMTKDYARCSRGQKEVVWLTQAVPENLPPKGAYTFSWIAALGWISQPETEFQLFLEDKPLLKFTVTHTETVWKSNDAAASLRFIPVSEEGNGLDRVGFMELSVPVGMLKGGRKTKLRVVAPQTGSHRWFGVYHYPLAGKR